MTATATESHGDEDQQHPDEPQSSEELRWSYEGFDSDEVGDLYTGGNMRRRLPALVKSSFVWAWRIDPRSTIALVALQVLSALLAAVGLSVMTKALNVVIQAASQPDRLQEAVPSVLILVGAAGLRAVFAIVIQVLAQRLSPRVSRELGHQVLTAGTRMEMSAYDAPAFPERYDRAERGVDVAQQALAQTQNLVSSLASLIAAAVVVAALYPLLLPLLLLAAIPRAAAALKGEKISYQAMISTFRDRRVLYLLRWFLVSKDQADQVRTDTISPFVLGKYRAAGERVDTTTDRAAIDRAKVMLAGSAATGAASAVLWLAVWLLLDTGRISAAVAGTTVFALRSAAQGLQGVIGYGSELLRTGFYMEDANAFIRDAQHQRIDTVRGHTIPPRPNVIALDKVTFTYPGADEPTLHEVTFTVRRGEIVAVVGENGSGKTTLMKLLCGLNLPTTGRVTWDDTDIAALDADAMWKHTAVVPQEFARWPLTCRENITLGQPRPTADQAVEQAAVASGADDVITSLRSGLDTLLAREMWGGVALSSGQWQRLAVARALHRDAGLLVMDEPTSDLDARAEHRIYQGLRRIAADRAVVLVTHNLRATAVADRIVCMEHGRITEAGTYTELLAKPEGLFQRLWTLQNERQHHTRDTTASPEGQII